MRVHDAIGIGLSGACVAHCLAVPVLISLAPALVPLENEYIHVGLATMALLTFVTAVRNWPEGLLGLGLQLIASLSVAGLFLAVAAAPTEWIERVITTIAAMGLGLSHLIAWVFGRRHIHAPG